MVKKFTNDQLREITVLRKKLTNQELYKHLCENFNLEIGFTSFREQLYKLGFKKCRILRWTKEETQFLINNYHTKGNKEISELLTKNNRIITIKNVQKKMQLLGIKRTSDECKLIVQNHKKNGVYKESTARVVAAGKRYFPNGFIKPVVKGNSVVMKIKIDGKFKCYNRYRYEQLYGKIPNGYKVYPKDYNFRNIEDDNLVLKKATGNTNAERKLYQKHYDEYFKEGSQNNPKIIPIEKKTIPEELKINLISVKIGKTIIKVKPGTNIAALKARYETRKFV